MPRRNLLLRLRLRLRACNVRRYTSSSRAPSPQATNHAMTMGKLYNLMVAPVQEMIGIQACTPTFWERLGRKPHHILRCVHPVRQRTRWRDRLCAPVSISCCHASSGLTFATMMIFQSRRQTPTNADVTPMIQSCQKSTKHNKSVLTIPAKCPLLGQGRLPREMLIFNCLPWAGDSPMYV